MHMIMALVQLIIGQAGMLAAKHQSNLSPVVRLYTLQHYTGSIVRIDQWPGQTPVSGAGTQNQITADQRLFQCVYNRNLLQDIIRT